MDHRRDPRRLPKADELKRTTEPLEKKRKVKQAEDDALKQAVEDLNSGNPQDANSPS
jgi:hypothetical protein